MDSNKPAMVKPFAKWMQWVGKVYNSALTSSNHLLKRDNKYKERILVFLDIDVTSMSHQTSILSSSLWNQGTAFCSNADCLLVQLTLLSVWSGVLKTKPAKCRFDLVEYCNNPQDIPLTAMRCRQTLKHGSRG